MEKPLAESRTLNEKALPVIRWQPVQWQAMVIRGGALMVMRSRSQRQPASQGSFQSITAILLWAVGVRRHDGCFLSKLLPVIDDRSNQAKLPLAGMKLAPTNR
jgi:hypothetical protein